MDADTFNALYAVGTPVRVFPNTREDPPRITRTRTRAVQVQRPFDTRYVDPLPDNYPVEA